jgi:archaellum component FlaC
LSALAKLLPDLGEAASQGGSPANEAKVAALVEENHEILGAAMRIVEAQPVTALGYAVRSRIREAVTEDVWSSAPVKIMRWAAPFLFVVFFGGTLFYSYRFEGLVNLATQTANQAVADIKSNANQVHTLTTEAESQVNSVKEQSNSANKTLTDMQTRLGQVGSDLSARSGEVDSLKTKIKEQEGRIDRLQKTIGETQEIVDAREQFARAIRQVSPQMGEQTWAMVLKIALYEDIVMLIAAAFTIIWFFNFMYSHFKK